MEELNSFRKVGKYQISNICLETYPCQHFVKFKNGEITRLFSHEIYRLFKSEGLSDSHIDGYAEYVRQCDNPTLEEITKREHEKIKIQQDSEKRKQAEVERQIIVNQSKASSRIDKLKSKHNIK